MSSGLLKQLFRRSALYGFLLIALCSMLSPTATLAATQDDFDSLVNNTPFYNPNEQWCSDRGGTGTTTSLTGKDNVEKTFRYFVGRGLSPVQAAAVTGNIMDESRHTIDPTAMEKGGDSNNPLDAGSGGWGIVQWTPGSKALDVYGNYTQPGHGVVQVSGDISTLAAQLDMVWDEMNDVAPTGVKDMVDNLKKQTTIETAVIEFQTEFESGVPGDRLKDAQEVQGKDYYASASASLNPTTGTSSSSTCGSAVGSNGNSPTCNGTVLPGGKGDFKTNTTVKYPGVDTMIARACELSTNPPGDPLHAQWLKLGPGGPCSVAGVCNMGWCLYTTAFLWSHGSAGYGNAATYWDTMVRDGHAHKASDPDGRTPPVGAVLSYASNPDGDATLYLGNNLISATDQFQGNTFAGAFSIESADLREKAGWNLTYEGWSDPFYYNGAKI
jgi:hypothetical protein